MITRLKLENFRRHADTEIVIAEGEQIIAVSGKNGAGKSTLLEAIVFALFGQSRHGNRGLDGLIRNGAELEGMSVELEFTVGDDTYLVTRRRDGKAVSALLAVNDIPLHEGTKGVNEAVVNLLGTDAVGFRLAAVAQQKELDALIRLGPTERVKSISRLLRLDAVSRAKDEVGRKHSKFVTSMKALGSPADRAERKAEVADLEARVASAEAHQAQVLSEVAKFAAVIENAEEIDKSYRDATAALAAASASLRAAQNSLVAANADLESVVIPEAGSQEHGDIATVRAQVMDLSSRYATAAEAAKQAAENAGIAEEIQQAQNSRDEVLALIGAATRESVLADVEEAEHALAVSTESLARAQQEQSRLSSELAVATAELSQAQKRRNALDALGDQCEACGQEVTETHKHTTISEAQQLVDAKAVAVTAAQTALDAAGVEVEKAEADQGSAAETVAAANKAVSEFFNNSSRLSDIERRLKVYSTRKIRTVSNDEDLTELESQKKAATELLSAAEKAEEKTRQREIAMARQAELGTRVEMAQKAVSEAQQAEESASIDPSLAQQWEDIREAQANHREALAAASDAAAAVESTRGELNALLVDVRHEESIAARLAEFQRDGSTHALAKRLLAGLETKVGGDVIPSLESAASEILDAMSEGRYNKLKLDSKYTPSVSDAGVWRMVQDLSGGEQDLVALALRLAVAELITERNSTGFGFLILDEVLGSQDAGRRESILSSLRALKRRYGQVWCISHVGGVEDVADRVVEIDIDSDGVATAI